MTKGGKKRFGDRVEKSLSAVGIETRVEIFEGECFPIEGAGNRGLGIL